MHTASRGPRSLFLVAVMALALVAAACAGDGTSSTDAGGEATPRPTATAPGEDDGEGMPGHAEEEDDGHEGEEVDDGHEGEVDDEVVVAGHDDFSFEPDELTLDAGTYRFVYRNEGQIPHQLAIARHGEGHHHVGDTGEVPGGETASFVIDLESGTYEMMCDLEGHYEAGMHGKIVVE